MGDSYANMMMIGLAALLIFLYCVFPHIVSSLFEKIAGSTHDAKLRAENKGQVFMQSGRLADRYAGLLYNGEYASRPTASTTVNANANSIKRSPSVPAVEIKFCPYCGADMSGMEKDDMFCTNCGAKLR